MACEVGTFMQAKRVLAPRLGSGFSAYLAASFLAGLVSAWFSTPADVIKTRLMAEAGRADTSDGKNTKRWGVLPMARQLVSTEGPRSLYKGFSGVCLRKVAWCGCFYPLYELILERLQL